MSDITDPNAPRRPGRPTNAEVAARNAGARTADREPEHMEASGPDHREPEHDPAHDRPRTRVRSRMRSGDVDNPHYFPLDQVPEGLSYEWKRYSVVGQENPYYLAQMRTQGWEPVQPSAHRNLLPSDYSMPYIIREGLILMERPIELTREAIAEQRVLAKQQVREAEGRLGMAPKINGIETGTRQHPELPVRVEKQYVRAVQIEP